MELTWDTYLAKLFKPSEDHVRRSFECKVKHLVLFDHTRLRDVRFGGRGRLGLRSSISNLSHLIEDAIDVLEWAEVL
jgi:hypothetical protein